MVLIAELLGMHWIFWTVGIVLYLRDEQWAVQCQEDWVLTAS